MKRLMRAAKPLLLFLFMATVWTARLVLGQDPAGPGPKKPRALEDYAPSTLKEIDSRSSGERKHTEIHAYKVRAVFTGYTRPISQVTANSVYRWAQCCAGTPDHYAGYDTEMQFDENGLEHWLVVEKRSLPDFQKELKNGDAVDLYLIRVAAEAAGSERNWALLVEKFTTSDSIKNQARQETVGWIRAKLPFYTEKNLTVRHPEACQLTIEETVSRPEITRAFVTIPLNDLDAATVEVDRPKNTGLWEMRLHTNPGKRSILFMLYQGNPAEGAQSNKYSLSFPAREKAEEMAQAFRRAIKLCTRLNSP